MIETRAERETLRRNAKFLIERNDIQILVQYERVDHRIRIDTSIVYIEKE